MANTGGQPQQPVEDAREEEETERNDHEDSSTVAALQREPRDIPMSNPVLVISEVNQAKCRLTALIDTGSPVSFIKNSIFRKYTTQDSKAPNKIERKFSTLSRQPITITTHIKIVIRFELELDTI